MPSIEIILGLLVAVVILGILAGRLKIPYPILFVLGGLVLSFIPGLPTVTLDPNLVLLLFLPPLVYGDAWSTSWRDFRANLRTISRLAIGLVLVTVCVVAIVAHMAIPGISWPEAFVLGAIVSPTDAVAASTIAERLGVPRRIITIVEGESLVNDASGLVAYSFAVAAVLTGTFSLVNATFQFVLVVIGGIVIGLIVGWIAVQSERILDDPPIETMLSFLMPFVAYIPAQLLHVSGILAVVAAGLYAGRHSAGVLSANSRIQSEAVWDTLIFLLNGLIFILIGLQLHTILNDALAHNSLGTLLWYGALTSAAVILTRIVWAFSVTTIARLIGRYSKRLGDPFFNWRTAAVVSWNGMRGVVSLAAALALALTITTRNLIIFLTFCVILSTLVLQGLTLPLLIRRLGMQDDGTAETEEIAARLKVMRAALARIEELAQEDEASVDGLERLREHYKASTSHLAARALGRGQTDGISNTDADGASDNTDDERSAEAAAQPSAPARPTARSVMLMTASVKAISDALGSVRSLVDQGGALPNEIERLRHLIGPKNEGSSAERAGEQQVSPDEVSHRLKREVLQAERNTIIQLRNEGTIGDDVMRRIERDLDLEELRIKP